MKLKYIPFIDRLRPRSRHTRSWKQTFASGRMTNKSGRNRLIFSRRRSSRGVKLPLTGHALQRVRTTILESQPRAGHEVLDRAGDQHFVGSRQRSDARANVHCQAGDRVALVLDFSHVQPRSDGHSKLTRCGSNGQRTAHAARGTVEGSEKAVTRRIDFLATKGHELATHHSVMAIQQIVPRFVAHAYDMLC